jgi:predicted metal-dependent hydrolase
MVDYVQFGSKVISFNLEYSNRKSLGITVTSDMEVLVKAPIDAPIELIKDKLTRKAPWIIKQQSFFLAFHPRTTPRKYIGGETHLYLGRQYCLKINISSAESVKLKGRFIEVNTSDKSKVKQLVNDWYLQNARAKLFPIAQILIEKFNRYHVAPNSIFLREMPTRWGSCTPKGKILLNPELIKAPRGCIEYVIIHELCHLVYHDHTQKFLDLQSKQMPDWEKWKSKLERLLA